MRMDQYKLLQRIKKVNNFLIKAVFFVYEIDFKIEMQIQCLKAYIVFIEISSMKLTGNTPLAFKKKNPAAKAAFGNNIINALMAIIPCNGNGKNFSNLPVPVNHLKA